MPRVLPLFLFGLAVASAQTCYFPLGVPSSSSDVDSTGFVAKNGKLKLSGVQLVNAAGSPVQLMGVSSHGLQWFPACYTKASIQYLAQHWGITVFRPAMYIGEGGYATNPGVKDLLKSIVQWCGEIGIYVIIDWHVLNPGNPNDATYSSALAFWQEMATLYKASPHVLYELANEPNGVAWSVVKSYHDRIIPAIRAIDPQTVIIAGTSTWSQDIDLAAALPVAQPYNVMYTFHFYAGTHASLLPRLAQQATKIPIFVTEWGATQSDGTSFNGNGNADFNTALSFLEVMRDANGTTGVKISSAAWSYADKSEGSALIAPGSCATANWGATSCSGAFLRNYIQSRSNATSKSPSLSPSPAPSPSLSPSPSPSLSPSPSPSPSVSPSPTACGFTFGYNTTGSWNGGFNGAVSVTPWTRGASVVLDFSGTDVVITSAWNGQIASSASGVYTIQLPSYDSTAIGFTATGTARAPKMRCVGAAAPPPSPTPPPCILATSALTVNGAPEHQVSVAALATLTSIAVFVGAVASFAFFGGFKSLKATYASKASSFARAVEPSPAHVRGKELRPADSLIGNSAAAA